MLRTLTMVLVRFDGFVALNAGWGCGWGCPEVGGLVTIDLYLGGVVLGYPRGYLGAHVGRARSLRRDQTREEAFLWRAVRNRQLAGHKFRRQQPIGPYIADFVCAPAKLIVELDGGQHGERKAEDQVRDAFLRREGYRVLRFWNHEVFENPDGVLETIYRALEKPG